MTEQQHDETTGEWAQQDADTARTEQQQEPAERESPNREAARYRTRLREVEGERDALAARVQRLQRAAVARLVGDRLAVPDDLLAFGLALEDLLTEDGEVDAELVNSAVFDLLTRRPGLAVVPDKARFPDLGGGRRGTTPASAPGWADLVRHPR